MVNLSLYSILAVIILDDKGNRVISKYYDPNNTSTKEQKAFEKGLFEKTKNSQGHIILYDNRVVLFQSNINVTFYVVGSPDENELVLDQALKGFYESVSIVLGNQVEKQTVMNNLDLVLLCLDEVVDNGIILEIDHNAVAKRVLKPRQDVVDISDQPIGQALATFSQRVASQLLR